MNEPHTPTTTDPVRDPATWPTTREASVLLGLSSNAIRQRIRRGSLVGEKVNGVWRVQVLAVAGAGQGPRTGPQSPGYDQGGATGDTTTHASNHPGQVELVAELRSERAYLREQLATRDREIERRDVIILRLTESLQALPLPREEPDQAAPVATSPGVSRIRLRRRAWDLFLVAGAVFESIAAVVFVVGFVAIASQREDLGIALYGLSWVIMFLLAVGGSEVGLRIGTSSTRRRQIGNERESTNRRLRMAAVALGAAAIVFIAIAEALSFEILSWYFILLYSATLPLWFLLLRWVEGRGLRLL